MIDKKDFIKKYNISMGALDRIKLQWPDIESIAIDYDEFKKRLVEPARLISETLRSVDRVHSVKSRIKSTEHLLEKIIRKLNESSDREINIDNYKKVITDLIGIRVLHLFKYEWENIDSEIRSTWRLMETPIKYVRDGDLDNEAESNDIGKFDIKKHKYGYRSIHYIIEHTPYKDTIRAEIQVRTIFEEAWSEIDHTVRYPYDLENPYLRPFLMIFNRVSGSADEMGTFIIKLRDQIRQLESDHQADVSKREKVISELKQEIESLKIKDSEKTSLSFKLSSLNIGATNIIWENPLDLDIRTGTASGILDRRCLNCGEAIPSDDLINDYCKKCRSVTGNIRKS